MKANISGESAEMYGLKISGAILKKLRELIQNFKVLCRSILEFFISSTGLSPAEFLFSL